MLLRGGPPEGGQGMILLVLEVQPMLNVVEDEHA
jgi:hypothetical protein